MGNQGTEGRAEIHTLGLHGEVEALCSSSLHSLAFLLLMAHPPWHPCPLPLTHLRGHVEDLDQVCRIGGLVEEPPLGNGVEERPAIAVLLNDVHLPVCDPGPAL